MDDDSKHLRLLKASIEHLEMDYLKAIGGGPGYPLAWIFDLRDPTSLEHARRLRPAGQVEARLADAEARGVHPVLTFMQVLVKPYSAGDDWWQDCPPGSFPVAVATDGRSLPF